VQAREQELVADLKAEHLAHVSQWEQAAEIADDNLADKAAQVCCLNLLVTAAGPTKPVSAVNLILQHLMGSIRCEASDGKPASNTSGETQVLLTSQQAADMSKHHAYPTGRRTVPHPWLHCSSVPKVIIFVSSIHASSCESNKFSDDTVIGMESFPDSIHVALQTIPGKLVITLQLLYQALS